MIKGIRGNNTPLPLREPSHSITELTELIAEIATYPRGRLRYESDTLVKHVEDLITETTGNLYIWCREYTPEMQSTLTQSCNLLASLVPLVKASPQLKSYPETVVLTIAKGLEYLCLDFHRQLYQLFPADCQLPDSYLKMETESADTQYNRLLEAYPDSLLLKAMLGPIHKLLCNPFANGTKEKIDYIHLLLVNIKLWHRKKGTEEQLYEIALAMNLNCPRLLHRMAVEANTRIQKCSNGTEQLECIAQMRRQYRHALASVQWKFSPHGYYTAHTKSVAGRIEEWLTYQQELASEETKLGAAMQQAEDEGARAEISKDSQFFSILTRVQVTAGLTKQKKFAPVLRAFCRVISFARSVAPSPNHLITQASSRVPDEVLDKLEVFLNECLLIIRKIRRNGGKFPDDVR